MSTAARWHLCGHARLCNNWERGHPARMVRPRRPRSRNVHGHLGMAWLAPLVALTLGCALPKLPDRPALKLDGELQQRKQEVAREFDQSRELAEFQSAQAQWEQGDAKACEQSLQALLKRNPAYRDARLLLADVYLAGHRTAEAQEEMQKALESHPHDAQVQYAMGLVLEMSRQPDAALAYYERAAQWEPDNEVYSVGYHTALEAAKRAGASAAPGTTKSSDASPPAAGSIPDPFLPDPAMPTAPMRLAAKPAAPAAGADRGTAAARAGSAETAGADAAAEVALQKGDTVLREGSPERALAYFREAVALRPNNPQILISAATAALRQNQPDLAIELLQPAAKRFAGCAALERVLGAAYYRLGDYQSSQVALQQALSLDKSSALSYFLMGCTLLKLGQRESAEAHLQQAQALDPRYTVWR